MIAALSGLVAPLWGTPKNEQILDPISTLGMLALRTLKCYEHAKPAVCDNWFYFDAEETGQGLKRLKDGVGNDDLYFLEANFRFFVKAWTPVRKPELVAIVKVAVDGLKIMRAEYDEMHKNAANTCKVNIDILEAWLPKDPGAEVQPPERPPQDQLLVDAKAHLEEARKSKQKGQDKASLEIIGRLVERIEQLQIGPAAIGAVQLVAQNLEDQEEQLTHIEHDRRQKAYTLWPHDEIVTFNNMLLYKNQKAKSLIGFLESKKIAYLELRQPNSK